MLIRRLPLKSVRSVPRERLVVSPLTLRLLRPLFRYHRWRDAWILRGIGEYYGPVLVRSRTEVPDFEPTPSPRPARETSDTQQPLPDSRSAPKPPGTPRPVPTAIEWPKPPASREPTRSGPRELKPPPLPQSASSLRPQRVVPSKPSVVPPQTTLVRAQPTSALRPQRVIPPRPTSPGTPVSISPPSVALILTCTLVAAALGFTIARSAGGQQSLPVGPAQASKGLLRISIPSGWQPHTSPDLQPLALTDEMALRPATDGVGTLVIGRIATPQPSVLPQSWLATLRQAPQRVTLGGARFTRYLDSAPQAGSGSESLYVVPTRAGIVVGVCLARDANSSFAGTCQRVLATLRLSSTVLGPGLSAEYAASLSTTLRNLNAARISADIQLRGARDARHQAIAESELAIAHAAAATVLLRLNAGQASAANFAVSSALRTTSDAYGALALAAARSDAHRYDLAQASLARATTELYTAFAKLRAFGYGVG